MTPAQKARPAILNSFTTGVLLARWFGPSTRAPPPDYSLKRTLGAADQPNFAPFPPHPTGFGHASRFAALRSHRVPILESISDAPPPENSPSCVNFV